ncbi:MAG TPA: peroxiredoxin [Gemmatimonadales bacterium]|nr:peroxiredoxin [Gemmatimonadales bacterium]
MKAQHKIRVGDVAPDFTLPDQWGKPVRLSDLIGRRTLVVYFYPKDETPGCTLEARAFRDSYEAFTNAGAEVIGVSADSVPAHRRFASRHALPFLLLSDRDGAVRALYGVEKTLGLLPGRVTFVIDAAGVVRHIFSSQLQVTRHSREAARVVQALRDEAAPS